MASLFPFDLLFPSTSPAVAHAPWRRRVFCAALGLIRYLVSCSPLSLLGFGRSCVVAWSAARFPREEGELFLRSLLLRFCVLSLRAARPVGAVRSLRPDFLVGIGLCTSSFWYRVSCPPTSISTVWGSVSSVGAFWLLALLRSPCSVPPSPVRRISSSRRLAGLLPAPWLSSSVCSLLLLPGSCGCSAR